jgi:2-dehydro-3-deoxyphosphogalactonate aldolase
MHENARQFQAAAKAMPLIAILRGVALARADGVARSLVDAGFRVIEVPVNRPGAFEAIRSIRAATPAPVMVGAGTVLTREEARAAFAAGARLLVAPNLDAEVMDEARSLGAVALPGVMTPSEAFAARKLGAHALKLFPAEVVGPQGLKALRAVLPSSQMPIYAVGGVAPETMGAWHEAGADGFGIGSALFRPEFSDADITGKAAAFVAAWRRVAESTR